MHALVRGAQERLHVPWKLTVAVALAGATVLPLAAPEAAGADPVFTEYSTPSPDATPYGITNGPDGALWFSERDSDRIGRTTTSGVMTEYQLPTANSQVNNLATGSDGAIWFTETGANKIGRITTSGTITEYPTVHGQPMDIVAGPDGNLWYTVWEGYIGKITTAGTITEYRVPAPGNNSDSPRGITVGPDGALWFTEQVNGLGRITTAGVVTEFPIPSTPFDITTGPDGALWYSNMNGQGIGRVTTTGSATVYPTSNAYQYSDIITGPDGALWFTGADTTLRRMTTDGTTSTYAVPTQYSTPIGLVVGPDDALWFTEFYSSKIGRATVDIPLDAPANLTANGVLVRNAQLSWQAVPGANHYEILRDGQSIRTSNTTSYTDSEKLDSTYVYTVRAVPASGSPGALSNGVTVTVDGVAPVTTITAPSTNQVASGNTSFTAQITDTHQRRHYIAIYSQSGQLVQSFAVNYPASGNFTYNWDSTAAANGKYRVEVSAVDSLNNKDTGSTKSVWFFVQN